ncbi:MAG: hypothetical protein A3I66_00155 [Burkholderiales bacterium RIFCSPLOWO2_02_FULL_57_36]|nr:MAG: hypothetical protein A3I66_00155 [Burkholderiales bacterium RIFCSPLOWO2_02_FULL_57_36]
MFDLRALKYFVAAYEEGSITAAAKRCFIAQPSISAAIQNLEASLDTRLFERAKSGLTATADGEKLYPKAKGLLAESNAILEGFRQSPQREIRLHIQGDLLISRAGPLIALLYQQVPNIKIKLTQENEAFDLKLVSEHCRKGNEWMELLWEEDYVVLIPGNHPLRFKTHFDLADLHEAPFIDRPYCIMSQLFTQLLAQRDIRPDVRASVVREEVMLGLVELGVGIAVAPESHCEGLKNVITRPLKHDLGLKRRVGLACLAEDMDAVKLVRELAQGLSHTYARRQNQNERGPHAIKVGAAA